ncbi:MAG: hypothetical protein VB025_03435 [Sphaerochaeta sp.]|nr:hypothetical protein [Sphaerochaeta sp.]
MAEERLRILGMLAEGKITADEADRLLEAMSNRTMQTVVEEVKPSNGFATCKYMHIRVEPKEGKSSERVVVKVPLALVKAGLNFSKLIPKEARDKVQESMDSKGIPFNMNEMKFEDLEEMFAVMEDLSIDVDTEESTIQVFCR